MDLGKPAVKAGMPRNARWLALAPLLACLLCPGHLLALASLLGLAWGRGHDPDFGWELWLAGAFSVVALCAVEWQIRRRGHCRHGKHS